MVSGRIIHEKRRPRTDRLSYNYENGLVVERESLERKHLGFLVYACKEILYGCLAVSHLILLLLKSVLLEELVQTAIGDVVGLCLPAPE